MNSKASRSVAFPKRGEIYLIKAVKSAGDTKKRPAIVISIDVRNRYSRTVLVVPLTSDLSSAQLPTRILIGAGEGGLETDSLAACENIVVVQKSYLDQGPYGSVTEETLGKICRGIQIAIGGNHV
jgi:mRNA interferase MazF